VAVSDRERIAHAVRRLSMGVHPELVRTADDTHAAIARALDTSGAVVTPLELPVPTGVKAGGNKVRDVLAMVDWWVGRMQQPDRLVEERLTWFWHDHFATSVVKVAPYLAMQQHATLRSHALGNFAELLKAVAKDPAMLFYLDGVTNAATERNENFGRECLELFTMGRDSGYTQDDVVAASRAFTGWVVAVPDRPRLARLGAAPWSAVFVPRRHDGDVKTLLGTTAPLDMDGALDVLLEQPATARFVVTKLWRELVGLEPDDDTAVALARDFRRDWEIRPLVEAIVAHDAFTSDAAVRSKYRSPVEKLVGIVQASGAPAAPARRKASIGPARALRAMSYLPFLPPNVAGFPKGAHLLGPSNLVHTFDLLHAVDAPPRTTSVDDLMARFGIFDVSETTRSVLRAEHDAGRRFALAAASPEFTLT
jgi:uncharacterized protein (DUF1800 family)